MRYSILGFMLLLTACLLWHGETSAMMGPKKEAPKNNDSPIAEQESIKAEVERTLKDATPEAKEKYVQEQIKDLNNKDLWQMAVYRLEYSGDAVKPHLAELINSKHTLVQQAGLRLVGQLKYMELLEPVFNIFAKPPDGKTQEYARIALNNLASANPKFFITKLNSKDREVLILCMDALYANYNAIAPDLEKAFRTSEDESIRKNADLIIRRSVFSLLEGAITGNRLFLYSFGIRRAQYTPEQVKSTGEKAAKLSDLTIDIAIRMIDDPNEKVYHRRYALVVLGCLPQERAANAIIEQIKKGVKEVDTYIYVLGWNAHPNAAKFLCEIAVDPNYANHAEVVNEALASNPNKDIDATLKQWFTDPKTSEERRVRLSQIIARRHGEDALQLLLPYVANKDDDTLIQYMPSILLLDNPALQNFFLDILRRQQAKPPLKSNSIVWLILHRNRPALDWIMANYDSLSVDEKNAFAQAALRLAQQPQDKERCLAMAMFLLPKITSQQSQQMVQNLTAQLPDNELRYHRKNKILEENYRKEVQKLLDWWEQNKKEEKYNFVDSAPVVAPTPAPANAPVPAPAEK